MSAQNPWKLATFALGGTILVAAVAGGVVTAYRMGRSEGAASLAAPGASPSETSAPGAVAPEAAASDTAALPAARAPGAEARPAHTHPPTPRGAAERPLARSERSAEPAAEAPPVASTAPVSSASSVRPASVDVEDCNRYASSSAGTKTQQAVKGGAIGGLLGAALGAAGGAIAGGGKGAGKGAAIGGLVGIAGGTLYGINQANQGNAQAEAAYRDCMQRRGYTTASSQ